MLYFPIPKIVDSREEKSGQHKPVFISLLVESVSSVKFLCVNISSDLPWPQHKGVVSTSNFSEIWRDSACHHSNKLLVTLWPGSANSNAQNHKRLQRVVHQHCSPHRGRHLHEAVAQEGIKSPHQAGQPSFIAFIGGMYRRLMSETIGFRNSYFPTTLILEP